MARFARDLQAIDAAIVGVEEHIDADVALVDAAHLLLPALGGIRHIREKHCRLSVAAGAGQEQFEGTSGVAGLLLQTGAGGVEHQVVHQDGVNFVPFNI